MEHISELTPQERKESTHTESKIIPVEELAYRIYQGQSLPQDTRFLSTEKGGVFKYFNLEDITGINTYSKQKKIYPLVEENGIIVSLSELEQDPHNENNFWIKFVSTDPKYEGKGYASLVLKEIFAFAQKNNYSLKPSFYTEEGSEKIKHVIEKIEKETGVVVIKS